ncbi:helix-turn-helix domain-containing protein [Micromonospora chalcea]
MTDADWPGPDAGSVSERAAKHGSQLGRLLRDARERHGLTLLDVARKGDLNSRTIERWENGILDNFDAVRLRILCSVLEVDHRVAAVALGFVDAEDLKSRP